jgi:hypothetical protein
VSFPRRIFEANVGELHMAIATLREIGIELPTRCRFAAYGRLSLEKGKKFTRRRVDAPAARFRN